MTLVPNVGVDKRRGLGSGDGVVGQGTHGGEKVH